MFFVLKKGQRGFKFARELMISGHSVTSSHVESGAGGPLAGPLTQNIAEADRSQSRDCDVGGAWG